MHIDGDAMELCIDSEFIDELTMMPLKEVLFDCVRGIFFCQGLERLKHNLFAALQRQDAKSLFSKNVPMRQRHSLQPCNLD